MVYIHDFSDSFRSLSMKNVCVCRFQSSNFEIWCSFVLKALQKEETDPRFLVRMWGGPVSCQRSTSHIMSNVTVCVRISTTWDMFFFCSWESSINLAGDLL